jgi:hypothetical protein
MKRVFHEMRGIGLVLWCIGAVRMHKDGGGFCAIFRPWHPLTWLVLFVMVLPCALMGERLTAVVPLRLSKFWQDNRDQLQWVTPFTRLDALRPFKHRPARREA